MSRGACIRCGCAFEECECGYRGSTSRLLHAMGMGKVAEEIRAGAQELIEEGPCEKAYLKAGGKDEALRAFLVRLDKAHRR